MRDASLEEVFPLRARILRAGLPLERSRYPQDAHPEARYLAAQTGDGTIIGVLTYSPEEAPVAPGKRALRFRGMAVDGAARGEGVGRALMRELVRRGRDQGAEVLWAQGRDTALGFYERVGFRVVGAGFLDEDIQLPHHVVLAALDEVTA